MDISLDETLEQQISGPISADASAGASVCYEPEFEQLQEEIARVESPAATGVNWVVVVDKGIQILVDKLKNFAGCLLCVSGVV